MKYLWNLTKNALALRAVKKWDILLTVLLTLLVGSFCTFLVNLLIDFYPQAVPESREITNRLIRQADSAVLLSFLFGVCIFAPVVEEIIFRGVMWWALESIISTRVAFWLTTILFAIAHFDILHVVAVFPLGVLFGFLRWKTGSIWLPLLAHVLNNSLASMTLVLDYF